MSDANRVTLAYVAESSYGTTPGTPTLQTLRMTSESLKRNATYTDSNEIRSDRQVAYTVLTDANGGGDLNFEFSYSSYDDFLMAVLQASAWSSVITATVTQSLAAADNSINRASGDYTALSLVPGKWIRVSGFTTNGAIFYAKIVSVVALKIIVSGITLVNETATSTEIEQGAYIENGTTLTSYTLEKTFGDVASKFEVTKGAAFADMTLSTAAGAILTGKFGFLSKPPAAGTSTIASVLTAATTTSVMNAVTNVSAVLEAGSSFAVREVSFTINNNLRERKQVGTLGAISIGSGTIAVTGNLTAYYASGSAAAYAKFLNDTVTDLALVFVDNAGNAYIIDFPNIKFTQGSANATGINTDVLVPLEFRATIDPTELKTIRIQRWAA